MQTNQNQIKQEIGYVLKAQDYLLILEGLPGAKIYDIIKTKKGSRAIVNTLDKGRVEVLMLDNERPKPGDYFMATKERLSLPLKANILGRAFNPLGTPLDDKGAISTGLVEIDLDAVAPGIDAREIIDQQFFTGLTVIDTMLPIGKGQRELLFGEPRSGKSAFLVDLIVNQKGENKICIYAGIGRADIEIRKFIQELEAQNALDYTIILGATSSDGAPLISISPSVACSIAEHFCLQGKDVLLLLDDLGTHSKYSREIGLLSGRTPGRESYPPDIFYQHSRIVERAGNFNEKRGKGSITMIPVIETDLESFTNLIPTNVMSMTDGHLLFSASLRAAGQYPAVEVAKSVTRVGRQTQIMIHKLLTDKIRSLLADYQEFERFGRFGAELTAQTQLIIKRGTIAQELLKQEQLLKIKQTTQIIILSLLFSGFYDELTLDAVKKNKQKIITMIESDQNLILLAQKIPEMNIDNLIEELKKYFQVLFQACPKS